MTVDPVVLEALESSLRGQPADDRSAAAVRAHLAGLYLSGGQPARGLMHALTALTALPADTGLLSVAAACAAAAGDEAVAESLRARQAYLLDAAGPAPTPAAAPAGLEGRPPAGEGPEPVGEGPAGWDSTDPHTVTLADVAGLDDVKRRLQRSLLAPLANAGLRDAFAKQLRGGLLLWGPPGTGKTFVARALSGEMRASFLSATPADIYASYFGESERNVARLFASAREQAPAVVFLDELDAIGGRRSARHTDQARGVVNQLLTELDGTRSNAAVFVLGATNAPWDVEDALRRPGRFDRTVLVLPPDEAAREALLRADLEGRPTAPDLDLGPVVRATATFSGADLVRLCENAAERALDRSVELGGQVSPISAADLAAAVKDTPASTHTWLRTAATYVAASGESGEDFDRLRDYLRAHRLAR